MKSMYFLLITNFFIVGCSQDKGIEELENEYSVHLNVLETENPNPNQIAHLDQDQVEGLLTYVTEYEQQESAEFDVLNHSVGAEQDSYTIELKLPDIDVPEYELTRIIRFDVLESANDLEPVEITATNNGGGGVNYISELVPMVNTSDGMATVEIIGEWQGDFIYNNEHVMFAVPDNWVVELTVENLK